MTKNRPNSGHVNYPIAIELIHISIFLLSNLHKLRTVISVCRDNACVVCRLDIGSLVLRYTHQTHSGKVEQVTPTAVMNVPACSYPIFTSHTH